MHSSELPQLQLSASTMSGFAPFGTASSPASIRLLNSEAPQHDDYENAPQNGASPTKQTPFDIDMTLGERSPANTDNSPWIGGTGLGNTALGKSGRVIERLMAENDRLRREMKAEITKREELQRAVQTQKPQMESLRAENARLSNIKSMDDSIIVRRDRKIVELKAELEVERKKRESYERRAQEAERNRDEREEHSKQEIQAAVEQAKHASTHATILETSHRQLSAEYRQRIATINKTVRALQEDKEADKRRLAKLDVVTNQMRQELERMRKLYAELLAVAGKFQDSKEAEIDELKSELEELKQNGSAAENLNEHLRQDMEKIMGQMKWLMAVKKVMTEDCIASPPPSPPV